MNTETRVKGHALTNVSAIESRWQNFVERQKPLPGHRKSRDEGAERPGADC